MCLFPRIIHKMTVLHVLHENWFLPWREACASGRAHAHPLAKPEAGQVTPVISKTRQEVASWLRAGKMRYKNMNCVFWLSQIFLWSHSYLHIEVVNTIQKEIGTQIILKDKCMPFHCIWIIFSSSFLLFSYFTGFIILGPWNCAAVWCKTLTLLWWLNICFSLICLPIFCLSSYIYALFSLLINGTMISVKEECQN